MHACKQTFIKTLKKLFESHRIKINSSETVAIKLNPCALKLRETGATSDPLIVKYINNEEGRSIEEGIESVKHAKFIVIDSLGKYLLEQ